MPTQRYLTLDVFRGATVALMILVNNPGSWSHLYPPLAHAPWHGVTITDLVFPFFLFAVGNAMAFALPVQGAGGTASFLAKIGKRALWIFGLGLFLNISPFVYWTAGGDLAWRGLENLRLLGVLQRIAISYAFAALLVHAWPRRAIPPMALLLLLIYWALCVSFGHPSDPYSLEGFFGTALDLEILGSSHLYRGEGVAFDPEGLVSTLPCISQVMLGYLVGQYLRSTPPSMAVIRQLFMWGCGLVLAGWLWSFAMPLNKKLWTSSYVLFTTGWAVLLIVALVYLLELRNLKTVWRRVFVVFGSNALFIFCLSGFLLAVLMVSFYWLIAEQLHRRSIFIKV